MMPAPARAPSPSLRAPSFRGARLVSRRASVVVSPPRRRASSRAAASSDGDAPAAGAPLPLRVAVSGAGGRTGSLVMKLLASDPASFAPPRGLVRSPKSADKLRGTLRDAVPDFSDARVEIVEGDVVSDADLDRLCADRDALVVLTSAVTKPKIPSLLVALVSKIVPWMEARRPEFYFPEDGSPERVDWLGQKAQVDAAARSGSVRRVVIVSSMGGTQVDNFLNTMGGGGDVGSANILLWKRKAEMYLVARSPELEHVVVHPGGLLDKPGGERELLVGVDDRLLDGDRRSVPRADVARVVCGALLDPSAVAVSFDLASREPGEGDRGPTRTNEDVAELIASLRGETADYSKPGKKSPVPLP